MNWINSTAVSRTVVFCIAALLSAGVSSAADTYTWDGADDASWQAEGSYKEEGMSGEGDVVEIPRGKNPVVTDADAEFVGKLSKIVLQGNCTVVFDIANDHEVACQIRQNEASNASFSYYVYLVKRGAGTLTLSAPYSTYIYRTGINVEAGKLRFGDVAEYSAAKNSMSIVSIEVGSGGVVDFNGITQVNLGRLLGSGTITNGMETSQTYLNMQRENAQSEFSGKLCGNIRFKATANGTVMRLSGTESDFTSLLAYYDGVVALAKFGNEGGLSSVGTNGMIQLVNGGRLEYIGTGETTDKEIAFKSVSYVPVLDAGANGGVTFTGRLGYHTAPGRMRQFVLDGSNTSECVISGPWYELSGSFATYITKRGSGTWRRADNEGRNHRGVWAVENGTLRFDSVAEAGEICSLGLSTVLYDDVNDTVRRDSDTVPYALLLGGADTEGTLEYTGSADAYCATRPIGVKGKARLRNATGQDFLWRNVFGVGDGESVLVLDGDSTTADNRLETVTNAVGTLSIVKEGLGDWTLTGDVAFNGSLDVREGTLTILRDRTTPTWFRWNIQQNYAEWLNDNNGESNGKSNSMAVQIDEFALYSAAGVRLTKGLTQKWNLTSLHELDEGETMLEQGDEDEKTTSRKMAAIFSDTAQSSSYGNLKSGQSDKWMSVGAEETWIRIVMRLADDSAPVAAYDYIKLQNIRPTPYAYSLECSFNGREWTSVTNVVGASLEERHTDNGDGTITTNIVPWWVMKDAATGKWVANLDDQWKWESNHELMAANAVRPLPDAGFPVTLPVRTQRIEPIAAVSVASGAMLRADIRDGGAVTVQGIRLDCNAGIGTFENITFAANGTVDVVDLPREGIEFTPVLTGCEGFSNIENWSVSKDGTPVTRVHMQVSGGKIRFIPSGTVITIK